MKPRESGASAPAWINGVRFDSVAAAAARISLLLGWKVAERWVSVLVKAGMSMTVNGVRISAAPPAAKKTSAACPPLLRYPAGETPIDRGAPHAGP